MRFFAFYFVAIFLSHSVAFAVDLGPLFKNCQEAWSKIGTSEATERQAVLDGGGLFFDTLAFMGGEGSMHGYVCHEPQWGAFDHIHFTPDGQAVLAAAVWSAIAPVDVNAAQKHAPATTTHDDAGTH